MELQTWRKNDKRLGFASVGGPSRRGSRSRMERDDVRTVLQRAKEAITQRTWNWVLPSQGKILGRLT
jgi:hypothetical protein